jgi:hypothetical protein
VCCIIEAAARNGVLTLSYGPLLLTFPNSYGLQGHIYSSPEDPESSEPEAILDPEIQEEVRMAQLMIDDPSAYEQEIIDSALR